MAGRPEPKANDRRKRPFELIKTATPFDVHLRDSIWDLCGRCHVAELKCQREGSHAPLQGFGMAVGPLQSDQRTLWLPDED